MLDRPSPFNDQRLRTARWSFKSPTDLTDIMRSIHAPLGTIDASGDVEGFCVDVNLAAIQGLVAIRFGTTSQVTFRREIYAESQLELHFVEKGCHTVTVNGTQFRAPAGHAYAILNPATVEVEIEPSTSGLAITLSRHWCTALISHSNTDPIAVLSSFKTLVGFDEGAVDVLRRMSDLLTSGGGEHIFSASPLGACAFKDSILLTFMSGWPSQDKPIEPTLYPRNLKRALNWIDTNLALDFTMEELAGAAGTSVRTLQMYFRQYLCTAPRVFVTRLRLEKVRQDLLSAEASARVADIAAKWGFNHMGHFASVYKETYGESPSATRSKGSGIRKNIS